MQFVPEHVRRWRQCRQGLPALKRTIARCRRVRYAEACRIRLDLIRQRTEIDKINVQPRRYCPDPGVDLGARAPLYPVAIARGQSDRIRPARRDRRA